MNNIKLLIIALILCLSLCACASGGSGERIDLGEISSQADTSADPSGGAEIIFDGARAEINGSGASIKNYVLTVTEGGTYTLSGHLDGSVVVDVSKESKVELRLAGLSVTSDETSAIYIKSADKVTLTLVDGTENTFIDGETYAYADDAEPSACIYSADDLEIEGEGILEVYAKCRNGIQTKNDLRIKGGNITVTAPKNALKGKDSVEISGGNINVTGAKDAIKSDNETEKGRGIVKITGGTLSLTCQDDGIQAFRSVEISGGSITFNAGDEDINCDGDITVDEACIN